MSMNARELDPPEIPEPLPFDREDGEAELNQRTCFQVLFTDEVPHDLAPSVRALHWASVLNTAPAEPIPCEPGSVATLLYTSGTTGRSKGVLLPHTMFVRGAGWLVDSYGFRVGDVFHDWMPLSHIGGQLHVTMTAIEAGACLAQVPAFSRRSFCDEVRCNGATAFFGFSSILALLLEGTGRARRSQPCATRRPHRQYARRGSDGL